MQRPRRTTEFQEDVPGTITRKSRRHVSPIAPGTISHLPVRQSRIAIPVPLRSSSADRTSVAVPQTSSVAHKRPTPQCTPHSKTTVQRVLFTAEKQPRSTATGTGGWQNNKKWLGEQIQRISEHLCEAAKTKSIPGITPEFFARPNALKTISIKQFVAIINYFLHFISSSRLVVGTSNYVEDIVAILQRLNYPYQVNKSWLKTPNTQHSFGNVMLLFDFLMEFVPPQNEEQAVEMQFALAQPSESTLPALSISLIENQIPDVEFQATLLAHSEEAFKLWDKQLMQEFATLQQQTCDLLIRKHGAPNTATTTTSTTPATVTVSSELESLRRTIEELQAQLPTIDAVAEERYQALQAESEGLIARIKQLQLDVGAGGEQLQELSAQLHADKEEASAIKSRMSQVEHVIRHQSCSRQQRDELIEATTQLRERLQCQERTKQDIEHHNLHQQVLYSRAYKQLSDKVEQFNSHMREICYSQMLADTQSSLQLPFKPTQADVERVVASLMALRGEIDEKMRHADEERSANDQRIHRLRHELDYVLDPAMQKQRASLNVAQKRLQQLQQRGKRERARYSEKVQQLDEKLVELQAEHEQLSELFMHQQQLLAKLKSDNESRMSSVELEYARCADAREQSLDSFASTLALASGELEKAKKIVDELDKQLEEAKK